MVEVRRRGALSALLLSSCVLGLTGCGSLASWGGFGNGRFGLPGPGPFPAPMGGVVMDGRAISVGFWPAAFDIPFSVVLDVMALPITTIGTLLERRPASPPVRPDERAAGDRVEAPPPAPIRDGATVVFVIDVSSSMGWESMSYEEPDGRRSVGVRLERVQAEVTRQITALPPTVALDLVAFGAEARLFSPEPQAATDAVKASAIAWLQALRTTPGGVDTAEAVGLALASGRPDLMVAVFTDDLPSRGGAPDRHLERIRAANVHGARIDVHGVGVYGALERFCQAMARDAGGAFVEMP